MNYPVHMKKILKVCSNDGPCPFPMISMNIVDHALLSVSKTKRPHRSFEKHFLICMFVCLFVCEGLSSQSRIFHSYGDIMIAGEGLQVLTFAWHSWPLSSEGSLVCNTYCDTGHPFIIVISEDL